MREGTPLLAHLTDPIVKEPKLRRPRCGNPRERRVSFRLPPLKRGSGAPYGAPGMPASAEAGDRPAGRPRHTALHCGVLKPWGPASRCSRDPFGLPGGCKERALRVLVRGEAWSKVSREHGLRHRARRHRSPFTLSSPRERPSANGNESAVSTRPVSVNRKNSVVLFFS